MGNCGEKKKIAGLMSYDRLQVSPMLVAEYQGSVVRGPQARTSGHGFVVSLDLTLAHVKVSADSYNQLKLEKPPLPGDFCTVRITWTEMLLAAKENRMVLADIVSLMRRPPRESARRNSNGMRDSDGDESVLESRSESITDLRWSENPSDEDRPSSPDSIPDHACHSRIKLRRSKSVDERSRFRDDANRPKFLTPIENQYGKYDRYIQAMMQPTMAPRARRMRRVRALDAAPISGNYLAGICGPSLAVMAGYSHNCPFPPFTHQAPYPNHCNSYPMCHVHAYIL